MRSSSRAELHGARATSAVKAENRWCALERTSALITGQRTLSMTLPREEHRRRSRAWLLAPGVVIVVFLFIGSFAISAAQVPKSLQSQPVQAEPSAPKDPLNRETPRGTVMGFLKYGERQDFATAGRYLQLPSGQNTNLDELGKEFQALRDRFEGD